MLRSEVENYLDQWFVGTTKIFEYRQEFLPNEYINIEKKDLNTFQVDKSKSTYELPITDREDMVKLMTSHQLIYYQEYTWKTPMQIKTNDCECGAWVLGHKHHAFWCRKFNSNT